MGAMGNVLMLIGGGAILFAQLWVLVAAFKRSLFWGLAVLIIPFVALLFIILYFSDMKFPVLLYIVGLLVGGAGTAMHDRATRRQALEDRLRDLTTST